MLRNTDRKIETGKIVVLIIFILTILSIIYEMFKLDLSVIGPIIEVIDDAHIFMTLLSVIYSVYAVVGESKSYNLLIVCLIDVIVVNRLYSDKKWVNIITWLKKTNRQLVLFWVIATAIIVFLIYKLVKIRLNKKVEMTPKQKQIVSGISHDNIEPGSIPDGKKNVNGNNLNANNTANITDIENIETNNENIKKQVIGTTDISRINEENQSDCQIDKSRQDSVKDQIGDESMEVIDDDNPVINEQSIGKFGKGLSLINPFVVAICSFGILWGLIDYVCYNALHLDIKRPLIVEQMKDKLQYNIVLCMSILLVLFVLNLFILWRGTVSCKLKEIVNARSSFGISGVLAFIIEIIGFACLINKNDVEGITNTFLNALANSWFAFIFAIIITFLILQIGWTIFLHMIGSREDSKSFILELKERITKIEKKMVLLACNVVEGCVGLFDFIPDFFDTIGVLLFDEDEKGKKQ